MQLTLRFGDAANLPDTSYMHLYHILTIFPDDRHIRASHDAFLHEVLDREGISITAHCDGMGLCGKCVVAIRMPDGSYPPETADDHRHLSEEERAAGLRLACQWRVCGDAEVTIPSKSRINELHVLVDTRDVEGVTPRETTGDHPLGIAIDIGTTTVVGTLMDRNSGVTRAVSSALNGQYRYGADVISRIQHSLDDTGLDELHAAVVDTLNAIITRLLDKGSVTGDAVGEITVTGNTVMLHALHRESMQSLSVLPFEPVFRHGRTIEAEHLGLCLDNGTPVYTFPLIGGFVGGDTVACMISTDMDAADGCRMMIDVGTNGEVALSTDGVCITTSAPAGPAFEGRGISCGMHGTAGAIEHVRILPDGMHLDVINQQTPEGVCGTGLIDATAELLNWQVLDYTGRLVDPDELPDGTPSWLKQRIMTVRGENAFLLFDPESDVFVRNGAKPGQLVLTQKDIREVQLAKGAIATGCAMLLAHAGITLDDLGCVYLAGAFGNYLRPAQARRIGLLPDIPLSKLSFIGNAASTGAKRALVSPEYRRRAEWLAESAGHIDLAADASFQMVYADNMLFPEELNNTDNSIAEHGYE
jgi:uncharacterized 2Fe-2S/4Fe-4S cluster protein (DUF4445 family)